MDFFLIGFKEGGVVASEALGLEDGLFDVLRMVAGGLLEPGHV